LFDKFISFFQRSNCVFEDNAAKREVLSLTVKCPNSARCEWLGELRESENHARSCPHEIVECPNQCHMTTSSLLTRRDLSLHLESECPKRMSVCEFCNSDVLFIHLARHHLCECPRLPANCPACGQPNITRDQMNAHLNVLTGTCPRTIVPCSFRNIGCLHQDQRARMQKHYSDANIQHIMMMSTRLVEMDAKRRLDLESLMASASIETTPAAGTTAPSSQTNAASNVVSRLEEEKK
jgi:TNF receptor-associated factor 6